MRLIAAVPFLLVLYAFDTTAAERPTKEAEGFTSERVADDAGPPIAKAKLGEQAIYWVGLNGLEAERPYQTRCVVENADGAMVHEESFNAPPLKSRRALFCPYMPDAAGVYRYTVYLDGEKVGESEITAERRILGLRPAVFVSIFVALLIAALAISWLRKRD